MGAGASAATSVEINGVKLSDVKTQIGVVANKNWLDATEIRDLKEAKKEIKRLRGLAKQYLTDPTVTVSDEKPQGRAAVRDNAMDTSGTYEKKSFPKEDAMREMIAAVMKENILFKNCKKEETKELIDAFEPHTANQDEVVTKQGDVGEFFYVIESGSIAISILPQGADAEMKIGTFGAGTGFGELALMYNTPRAATCKSVETSKLWKLHRNTFRAVMTRFHAARTEKYANFVKNVVIGIGDEAKKLGDVLNKSDLSKVADALDEEHFPKGRVIVRQGEVGDYFYIIAEGEVSVHLNDGAAGKGRVSMIGAASATLKEGQSFGEKALLSEDTRKATCVAETDVVCLTLEREDFVAMLGPVNDILSGKAKSEVAVETVKRDNEPIKMEDLHTMQTLGQGAFGRVKLVKDKVKDKVYALKCQSKKAIVENQLQDHVMLERDILMMLDHPFILKLYAALQDKRYIYFVLEILLGGELFTWLRKVGHFDEPDAKFYSAQVVSGFHHMHTKKIAYRDLKPENLVLDEKGYLKIVDLGLAKVVDTKTWTLCGTPDYLAPEIILNEGHDKAVDYWALGVLIYELVAGIPPFYADDPMEVYEKILSSNVHFPHAFSKQLQDIVRKLLKLCASKRLGNGKVGANAIMKHKWYSGFDIEGMTNYHLDSPLKALIKITNPEDASNFDKYEEEAELMAECDWNPSL